MNFKKITDIQGTPIDPNILNIVIVLNNLGFTTEASCQGHLTHGLPFPWVDCPILNKLQLVKLQNYLNKFKSKNIKIELYGLTEKTARIYCKHKNLRLAQQEMNNLANFLIKKFY